MGSEVCESINNKNIRTNEVITDASAIHQVNLLFEVGPSVCKIIVSDHIGTGFFIKLYKENKPLFVLMTNEHVIENDMIEKKEKLLIYYNNQNNSLNITLNKNERFIQTYTKKLGIDCTIVEILDKDKINQKYFLHPNLNHNISNYKELTNRIISVVQFPGGTNLSYSEGKLTNFTIEKKKYEFTHKASTQKGSSGSPIFLANNTDVIGIHKSGNNEEKENYGDFIFPIINLLNNNNLIHKQNELKIIAKINAQYFQLFRYEFIEKNKDKCELFINGKNVEFKSFNDEIKDYKFLNQVINKYNGIIEIVLKETKIITNMDYMFWPKCDFISLNFEKWDVSNVTSMKCMFNNCGNIKGISNWNTSNVTNMSYMFSYCKEIPNISSWDTSKVSDMSYMFSNCNNIPSIFNWNISNVLDMSYMFRGCNYIPDISEWDTSNVKNMCGLFYDSNLLPFLPDISNWNTSNVENMSGMFYKCKSLKSLPNISKWDTFHVKDMSHMFHHCWSLTSFPNISNWNINNVKNMSNMFHNCWGLTSFPLLNWNISKVQNMDFMFYNIPLPLIKFKWNISKNQNAFRMFTNSYNYNPLLRRNVINIIFNLPSGIKYTAIFYSDTIVMDLIDEFYKKNDNLDNLFDIGFLCGNKCLREDDMNLLSHTISEFVDGVNIKAFYQHNIVG